MLEFIFSEPVTTIVGGPEMYINRGSTMNLTCVVRHSPEPPPAISWTHNHEVTVRQNEIIKTFVTDELVICYYK